MVEISKMMKKLTPMMQQYMEIKKQYPDCLLFFRMGDFYEMFGDDAVEASEILEITLTARSKGKETEVAMCGVPHHAAQNYISKLTQAGKKVAVCEQTSDPTLPGIVERKVMRVVTPGTTLDDKLLAGSKNNFLVGLHCYQNYYSLGFIDITTGEFRVADFANWKDIEIELYRLEPQEIIITKELQSNQDVINKLSENWTVNVVEMDQYIKPYDLLCTHFKVKSLDGFGIGQYAASVICAAHILYYVQDTQKTDLVHIHSIAYYNTANYMVLDEVTVRNLDLLYNSFDGGAAGSLLKVLDHTTTAMGGRLLRSWLMRPLMDKAKIEQRLGHVDFFVKHKDERQEIKALLKQISDIERLVGRIGCNRAHARDLMLLKNSLQQIPDIKKILGGRLLANLNMVEPAIDIIEAGISDDPASSLHDGGMIRDGYNSALDDLRNISFSGKDYIKSLQVREVKNTGITSLKVKFNKVFGYYIEITRSYLDKVPEHYVRKQTLVNAERYIIPELKEYEEKVLTAEDKIKQLEFELFTEILEKLKQYIPEILKNAKLIAKLDVYVLFAELAELNRYCHPIINIDGRLHIQQGRHPVIEHSELIDNYIPNNIKLDHLDHQLLLLTGPNMAGKSSYLRQTALIVLMAHIGCFVPAESAEISIVDRIFTRVGAADNINRGQSTFMVEMQEAANILHNATSNSLIILDEIGRGTSTYDGLSIAWAITEYIYQEIGAKTMFATHYHELINVVESLPRAQNYAMAVKELDDGVLFLHQVIKGACNQSYGIEVAKLAGLPNAVIKAATTFLDNLEIQKDHFSTQKSFNFDMTSEIKKEKNKIEEAIDDLDLNSITPMQAFEFIKELKG